MLLSLEEFITKRKHKDGINDFDWDKRYINVRSCVNYIFEYFYEYLEKEHNQVDISKHYSRLEKHAEELEKKFSTDIVDWLTQIYDKFQKRVDRQIKNFTRSFRYFLLTYSDEEFRRLADDFCKENMKKMPFLKDNYKYVELIIRHFHHVETHTELEYISNYSQMPRVHKWVLNTYKDYGVNISNFASNYMFDYWWKDYDRKKTYNCKGQPNLFDIDFIYEDIKDKPFMLERKKELEAILMELWLHVIVEDQKYLEEYISKTNNFFLTQLR